MLYKISNRVLTTIGTEKGFFYLDKLFLIINLFQTNFKMKGLYIRFEELVGGRKMMKEKGRNKRERRKEKEIKRQKTREKIERKRK